MLKYIIAILFVNIANANTTINLYNTKFTDANGIHFQIQSNNNVSGVSGCNNFVGKVQINVDKKEIKFLNLASTRKFCDDKANQIEANFLSKINTITNFEYQNNSQTLQLKDSKNNIVFSFKN